MSDVDSEVDIMTGVNFEFRCKPVLDSRDKIVSAKVISDADCKAKEIDSVTEVMSDVESEFGIVRFKAVTASFLDLKTEVESDM